MQIKKQAYKSVYSLYGKYKKIPNDWEHAKLDTFLKINMGQSPPSESYNETKKGMPFFQGVTEFGYIYPEKKMWCTEPKKIAEKNQSQ